MDLFVVAGFIGSVASIISLLIPSSTKKQRYFHAAYVLVIAITASTAQFYYGKWRRISAAEHAAAQLVQDKRMNYTASGFNMAALAFLEKNKELFPDSYARAQRMCEQHSCLGDSAGNLNRAFAQNDVSFALEGLVRGIATISR